MWRDVPDSLRVALCHAPDQSPAPIMTNQGHLGNTLETGTDGEKQRDEREREEGEREERGRREREERGRRVREREERGREREGVREGLLFCTS